MVLGYRGVLGRVISILENSLRMMTLISKIPYVVTLLRSNQGPS